PSQFYHHYHLHTSTTTPIPYTTLFRSQKEDRRSRIEDRKIRLPMHRWPSSILDPQSSILHSRAGSRSVAKICSMTASRSGCGARSEENTSELQSRFDLVCRLLLVKKNDYYCCRFWPQPWLPLQRFPDTKHKHLQRLREQCPVCHQRCELAVCGKRRRYEPLPLRAL